jgi:hypothetical protein
MIALRTRDNGQWLAAVKGPLSVACTVFPDEALSFATEDEARTFLQKHGLSAYFEPVAFACAATVTERKGTGARRGRAKGRNLSRP